MSLRRQLLRERKEIARLRKTRCRSHRTIDCKDERCRRLLLRPKKIMHNAAVPRSTAYLESLFYLVSHPMATVAPPAAPVVPIHPRKLTLRERIELAKTAEAA
jgi:hypothetical protein